VKCARTRYSAGRRWVPNRRWPLCIQYKTHAYHPFLCPVKHLCAFQNCCGACVPLPPSTCLTPSKQRYLQFDSCIFSECTLPKTCSSSLSAMFLCCAGCLFKHLQAGIPSICLSLQETQAVGLVPAWSCPGTLARLVPGQTSPCLSLQDPSGHVWPNNALPMHCFCRPWPD